MTSVCTMATSECQELTSSFEERDRQNLVGLMNLYEKSIYDIQRYIQRHEINFKDAHPIYFSFFQELEDRYERIKEDVQANEVISKEDI